MWKIVLTKIRDANALDPKNAPGASCVERAPTANLHLPTLINVANGHDTHLAGELLSKQSPSMNKNRGTSLFLATPITCAGRRSPHRLSTIKFLIGFISLLVASLSHGTAAQSATLTWDRNSEPDIAKYSLYYGTQSGNPSQSLDVGNVTTATVPNLNDGTTYFFTVTAVNTAGLESLPSNEVSHTTPNPMAHVLTVNNGSGTGNYVAGQIVTVSASTPPAGRQFDRWIDDWVILSNPFIATTTATMPSQDVTIAASYSGLPTYALTVNNGTGSGSYLAGTQVTVTANAAPAGQQFVNWTGDVQVLASSTSATTTATMPSSAVAITATRRVVDKLRFHPRSGWTARMVGGVFEGTNENPATGSYTNIHTITTNPPLAWTEVNVSLGNYRYLRYRGPNGSYGNVAEIELYRGGIKVEGTGYGTPGSWGTFGNTFNKALDGNVNSFFDGPTANGNYVGVDTGTATP